MEGDREFVVVEDGMFVAQRHGTLPAPLPKAITNKLASLGLGIEVRTMCQIVSRVDGGTLTVRAPGMSELCVSLLDTAPSEARVQVWKDSALPAIDQGAEAAQWFTAFLSRERKGHYRLMRMARSCARKSKGGDALLRFHDAFPFMMVSSASLGSLNGKLISQGELAVPMTRFRPNIVLQGLKPHEEDRIARLRIGQIEFTGKTLCDRCVVTCTDQKTAVRMKEPLRTLSTYRKGSHIGITDKGVNKIYFGRNFDHCGTGVIRVGDAVEVLEWKQ
ncbi:MAG: hypothetical protein A2849_03750 [Candidatus Taylorbacteria bacterium RIFCSPHIGHO2_01_FULL_51_15]|uniref:MOSC domain-containing protein n=1 Tax=Candidatus Taylorbacteria bacterium RIFCSPHIGHO2_01_FULL_51_15 TaxID=1802304 RepID=A0A1G2MEP1_9BACT|nr:MAG: hypothetical protein A2849_03750 [Candidatus Taylorbacteria bacterium RIFCSPHIGHO2_01_FULL_51_15]